MIATTAPAPVFNVRLRDAVDVLEEFKRRGVSEHAAALLMVYMAIDRVGDDLVIELDMLTAELAVANERAQGAGR